MLTIPPLEKIISRSRSSKMRNTNAITNSSSSVTSIETRADRNGGGLVYHRSDCGYPRNRVYGYGGNWPGSLCGDWIPIPPSEYFCGVYYPHFYADVVWYGEGALSERVNADDYNSLRNTYNNIKNKNEDGGGKHNWTDIELKNVFNRMKKKEFTGGVGDYRGLCSKVL